MYPTLRLFTTCILALTCIQARGQNQVPMMELQRFMTGKIWTIEQECVQDSCYQTDNTGFYWAEDIFNGDNNNGTASWCFTFRHAFYFSSQPQSAPQLVVQERSPDICVISISAESSRFIIHYASETGTYQMMLIAIDPDSFMLSGPSWGSTHTCLQFRAISPPADVAAAVAQSAGN